MSALATLRELRQTLALSAPIIAGFVGQMLMGLTDSFMVGRVGVLPLAACAFANTIASVFMVFAFGAISSVSICAAHSFGAGRRTETGEVLAAGLVASAALALLLASMMAVFRPLYFHLGQPPEVVGHSIPYLMLLAASLLPSLLMVAGKAYSEALSRPWLPFWIVLGGVLLNVLLNWIFIFGNWGAPAMGLTGAGLATLLSRLVAAVVLGAFLFWSPFYRIYLPLRWVWKNISSHFPALIRLGLPSGFQVLGEVGAFAFASLMMGWISVTALAAHQIAITCAATTFMIPLGLSITLTVRLGHALGARQNERLRPIAVGTLGLAVAVMSLGAAVFLTCGTWISSFFITDPTVIQLAAQLLLVAGIFQIFDGIQVVSVGGLRGLGDVRTPMVLTYANYWGVALPLSAFLAFGLDYGALGIWVGLAAGLAFASLLLGSRLWWKTGLLAKQAA